MARPSLLFLLLLLPLLAFAALSDVTAAGPRKMVGFYELKKGDYSIKVTNWGAHIVSIFLPDSKGNLDDVVLGYDGLAPYVNDTTYFGALVGRIGNRIAGARFELNGKAYILYKNDGNNSLHGGHRGFSHVIWTVIEKVDGEFPYIKMHYRSFDGEQGFPGDLDVYVTYKISGSYELTVDMEAKALNKATIVNLLQHTYWNLGGHNSGKILDNQLQIFASRYTPLGDGLIPTGQILPVSGTRYDFRKPMRIGSRIENVAGGYDLNYVLDAPTDSEGKKKAAVAYDPRSGRKLELWTNQPGLQIYTSSGLKDVKGKGGHVYGPSDALCLETQGFPDAVHHPNFPTWVVNPGETYKHKMLFKFSTV